jgi:glutamate-1-semialdehyde 2,1-aminomutase
MGEIRPLRLPQTTAYRAPCSVSRRLYEQALRVMPGGNTRHSIVLPPHPVYVRGGAGCRVTDMDGEERIDFVNNFTSNILGHADPDVVHAVRAQLEHGTAFAMPTVHEIALAGLLVERVSYIDRIRFCNSGTEAVMMALRAARAFTGKPAIAKFEGCYHGAYDYAQTSEAPAAENWGARDQPRPVVETGCVESIASDVVILPWNNPEACEALVVRNRDRLAAVIFDPLPMRIGFISPRPGFLQLLRDVTRQSGVLLICDEVLTFRLGYHGALGDSGVDSDLTTFGKIIGGGFPVGAVGGKSKVMEVFDHTLGPKIHHAGTFNANPITMCAGFAQMSKMTPEAYERLGRLGDSIRTALASMLARRGITGRILGAGSLFAVHLTGKELVDYRSIVETSRGKAFLLDLCHEMLGRGIFIAKDRLFGCLSTPMEEEDLDLFVAALDESLASVM